MLTRQVQDNAYRMATWEQKLTMSVFDWESLHKIVNLCFADNSSLMYHSIATMSASITNAQYGYLYVVDEVTSVSIKPKPTFTLPVAVNAPYNGP
jgi:hypothetical protein